MNRLMLIAAILACCAATPAAAHNPQASPDAQPPRWSLAIHGGAGTIQREDMTDERDSQYRAALQTALDAGAAILADGGTAEDAVIAAILVLEDDARFNAGKGAVLTWDGIAELDAALMTGQDLQAGAITGVRTIRNPILLAQAVKDNSRHVFLSGEGAQAFAETQELATVQPDYFITEPRVRALEGVKTEELSVLAAGDNKFGTVGAVALDASGNLAAGTSTGGLTAKRWGRIGDAPVLGAGTYADNRSCAVSATGTGEFFIRVGVAYEICTRLRYRFRAELVAAQAAVSASDDGTPASVIQGSEFALTRMQVQEEVDAVMAEMVELGGTGGVIVATPFGDTVYNFDTPGMYRGRADSTGLSTVALYAGEDD